MDERRHRDAGRACRRSGTPCPWSGRARRCSACARTARPPACSGRPRCRARRWPSTSTTASAMTMPTSVEIQPKMRCFIVASLPALRCLRAPWIACHTRCGVAGIWMLRTPSGHSASMIAFMTVGVEPTVPDSPTPLAPIGLVLAGTRVVERVVEGREGVGARHGVVHERAGDELAGLAVVDVLLEQRLADALRQPPWIWPNTIGRCSGLPTSSTVV